MKVCIVSDSHDNRELLSAAVRAAREAGAEAVLHCGDVVAPSTLEVIKPFGLPVHVIHGNNTGDLYMMSRISAQTSNQMTYHGQDAGLELAGRRIFLVHYPHYAMAMAATGDWDIVCCGHSHKVRIETVPHVGGGDALVVNPGTIGGVGKEAATWVLGDLETLEMQVHEVPKSLEYPEQASQ